MSVSVLLSPSVCLDDIKSRLGSWVVTFWEVYGNFNEGGCCVLIALVPGHCLSCSFLITVAFFRKIVQSFFFF